ncbi:hypothetical protein MMC29_006699 [Sticta canariensis]|nr:hypothetical protein [Sticta canariensis]
MATLFFLPQGPSQLRIQRKPLGELPYYEIISLDSKAGLSSPMIAFLDSPAVQFFREKLLTGPYRRRRRSWSFQILRRRFTPPENTPDPYIVAILIALAQEQRRRRKQNTNRAESKEQDADQENRQAESGGSHRRRSGFHPKLQTTICPVPTVVLIRKVPETCSSHKLSRSRSLFW